MAYFRPLSSVTSADIKVNVHQKVSDIQRFAHFTKLCRSGQCITVQFGKEQNSLAEKAPLVDGQLKLLPLFLWGYFTSSQLK